MRTLTITATEWASGAESTLWLVREGTPCMAHEFDPPAEFVQACKPCEFCDDTKMVPTNVGDDILCASCLIELVGPCCGADDGYCFRGDCSRQDGAVTLGHAYPVGSPLPIVRHVGDQPGDLECLGLDADMVHHWPAGKPENGYEVDDSEATDLTAALAHYGPPETLVGKWAMRMEVV